MNEISIIIQTYNVEKYLQTLLEKIKNQSIKEFELIIIDSSSKDKTVEIAKKYITYVTIPQSEFEHGGTRAEAAKISKGEILVFLIQDALPYNEKTIENIIKVFDDKKIGADYRKSTLEEIGWFKNNLILGEDTYAETKLLVAGYKLAYIAKAKVYHFHNYTIWEEFKRYFDIGVFTKVRTGYLSFLKKHRVKV